MNSTEFSLNQFILQNVIFDRLELTLTHYNNVIDLALCKVAWSILFHFTCLLKSPNLSWGWVIIIIFYCATHLNYFNAALLAEIDKYLRTVENVTFESASCKFVQSIKLKSRNLSWRWFIINIFNRASVKKKVMGVAFYFKPNNNDIQPFACNIQCTFWNPPQIHCKLTSINNFI